MDVRLTRTQLEDLFWRATVICLGLNPDDSSEAVQKRVRISWPSSETGNTDWERGDNVVFLRISPGLDEYGTLSDISYSHDPETDTTKEVVQYHRSHQVSWICYGPDSDSDADSIRIGILRNAIRLFMKEKNVAIQPHIPYSDAGALNFVLSCNEACDSAVKRGFLAPGVWNKDAVLNLAKGDTLEKGFICQAEPVANQASSDKSLRICPPIYVCANMAGAIHSVTIKVDVV